MISDNGAYKSIYTKDGRKQHAIYVERGGPLLFGENNEYSLVQDGFGLKVAKLGENGVMEKDILIHNAYARNNTLRLRLAMMNNERGSPMVLNVIRDAETPTYDEVANRRVEEVTARKRYRNFAELLETNDI